ncbi:hypothetical protein D4764_19G0003350 [Takifugu flavidus]|uniref:Reverse transcriptase domain-containing protein n=1 Tax=Takifugu flavidus TaxID=433684 RepID=A0A5C6NSH5_9TELE|nr:hypothetical protein D4764_19G0003350 [Takifugu flavidus]
MEGILPGAPQSYQHVSTRRNRVRRPGGGPSNFRSGSCRGSETAAWRRSSTLTLLSLPGKVYARVLEKRIRLIVEPLIEEEQCGFRPGRVTTDQLFTLAGVLEESWECAQPVHMCFVDLEKAYDQVPRSIVWGCSKRVDGPLIRAVQSLYQRSRSLVRIAGCKSDSFPVRAGLRQGCLLSPVLFITYMDRISRCSWGLEGVEFGGRKISSLLFVDDVVLLAPSSKDLQQILGRFVTECEAAGMWISTSK